MKKLFLLIPALVLSLAVNADVINITPTSPHSSNNLRQALAAAASGDIIEMAGGTYVETGNWLAVDDKDVTVRAAEGAEVIIKPQFSVRVKAGSENQVGKVEFDGVQFDCSALESSELFVPSDNKANQGIVLKNCELYDWPLNKALIHSTSARKLDVIDIDNCYFHGFEKSIVFVENASLVTLSITNSTFANVSASVTNEYWAAPIYVKATTGSVLVDRCTFYNVNSMSLGYGTVTVEAIADPVVSNCIFMLPASIDRCATYLQAGGTVDNCLTYNYDNWQPNGHYNTATVTNCVKTNPLFVDAENGDYQLRMGSPARDLSVGNPSLAVAVEPAIADFQSALVLEAADAVRNEYYSLDNNNYLKSANPASAADDHGIATWQIHATKAAAVQVTLNIYSGSQYGHTYKVNIFDSNNTDLGEVGENGWKDAAEDVNLNGSIYIPAAGDYTVQLSNICNNSVATIKGITLSYAGGDVQAIPATLAVSEAWFTEKATRADDKISFSTYKDQWAKWNIAVPSAGEQAYNVTLTIDNPTSYGHNFSISIYEEGNEAGAIVVSEHSWNQSFDENEPLPLPLGKVTLIGGKVYVVKVTNAENGSQPKIVNVKFVYAGGAMQSIPGTIALSEAILSARAFNDEAGLHFTDNDHLGSISGEWAKWNVSVANDGLFKFTAHCSSTNWSNLTIVIMDSEENELYAPYTPQWTYNQADKEITSPEWFLEAGNYVLKLSNPANNSNGYLLSLSASAAANLFVVDENATDVQYIKDMNGQSKKPMLKRSFVANMYNTVLFPFNGVTDEELTSIFGEGYELLEMTSAELEGNTLNLNFALVDLSQSTYGRPYLIKPTQDVVNPIFNATTIYASTSHLTKSGTNADFIGSYIKGEVPAGENNLFLGPNNLLYFSQTATPIKGMRAYFRVKGVSNPAQAIRRANIVVGSQVVTSIDLVEPAAKKAVKTIENGQLVINIDGIRYNAMGIKLQ